MRPRTAVIAVVAVAVLALAGYGLFSLGMSSGMRMAMPAEPAAGRPVLYWHDPMVPGPRFDKPGKSPFMDMQLVPVYGGDAADEGSTRIDPRVQQNLGVRTAKVAKGTLGGALEAVGSVAYNERDVALVQARANGFLEKLYVRAPLDRVRAGQPLAELYVPDWVAAQEELLAVRRMGAQAPAGLLEGARQRMRLAGMSPAQITQVEEGGRIQPRITIAAPIGGVVGELTAREGMTVALGAPLFRINGLGTVWINAEVPESAAGDVRPGTAVEAQATAYPGETFSGKVTAILPEVDAATRTLKARVEVANRAGKLVPGMFARVAFAPAARGEVLLVPSEAVIRTGERDLVMVAGDKGRFTPVVVEVGGEAGGRTEIRKGLAVGDTVVVSGQFLIDSEASIKGIEARAPAKAHQGEGKVEAIGEGAVTLTHGPIPSLEWGPMTMEFKLPAAGLPAGIAAGDTVRFETRQMPDGQFEITSIARAPGKAQ